MAQRSWFAFVLLLSLFENLQAQGFRMFTGRNHPEIIWEQHDTPHFSIMMPAHLGYMRHEAATVAEQTYAALSANTGVTFKDRIRIYLSDEDEITNGFAVPFGNGFTNIWVNVNESATVFAGDVKWLRKVLAHELAHIFHFKVTRSNIGLLGYLFGDPMPRFWSEGWAQLQTERWDSERGDRWIRKAVFEDRLSYDDRDAADNGRLVYATGNAQLRFFYELYGDSTFRKLSSWRDTTFGLITTHDFEKAFKKATGTSYETFEERWRKHVNIYYNSLAATMQREDSLFARVPLPSRIYVRDARFKPGSADTLAVLRTLSKEVPVTVLELRYPGKKPRKSDRKAPVQVRRLAEGAIQEGMVWSPDGARIAFVRNGPDRNNSMVNDLFVVDIRTGRTKRLTRGARVSYPAWAGPDRLVYAVTSHSTANLVEMDLKSGREQALTSFTGDVQIYHTAASPDGKTLAAGLFDAEGQRSIALIRPGQPVKLLAQGYDERDVRFSPDGRFLYATSLRDEVPNVFRYEIATGTGQRITAQFTGATLLDVHPDGDSLLVAVSETRSEDRIYKVAASPRPEPAPVLLDTAYSRWRNAGPERRIPFKTIPDTSLISRTAPYRSIRNLTHLISFGYPVWDANGLNVIGFTQWSDPLAHHQVIALGSWASQSFDDTFYLLSYQNNTLKPTLGFSLYKIPSVGQFYGGAYILDYLTGGDINLSLPVDRFHQPYTGAWFTARLRTAGFEPSRIRIYDDPAEQTGFAPEALRQTDLLAAFKWVKRHPTRSLIHPGLAYGFKLQVLSGSSALGGETSFVRPEAAAFVNMPVLGRQAVFVQMRGVTQNGRSLAQDFVGFSRYDNLQLDLPAEAAGAVFLSTADRVRGHRQFVIAGRTAFASAEYRIPLLPRLETKILGAISLDEVSLSLFADAGYAGDIRNLPGTRNRLFTGAGYEFKNALNLGGLTIGHAVGVGYRNGVFTSDRADWHYRIRASLPF